MNRVWCGPWELCRHAMVHRFRPWRAAACVQGWPPRVRRSGRRVQWGWRSAAWYVEAQRLRRSGRAAVSTVGSAKPRLLSADAGWPARVGRRPWPGGGSGGVPAAAWCVAARRRRRPGLDSECQAGHVQNGLMLRAKALAGVVPVQMTAAP